MNFLNFLFSALLASVASLHAVSTPTKPQQLTSPDQVPEGLARSDWSSIRAAYEAGRHAIHRQENGNLTARNPGQQWRTDFDDKGFLTTPDHGQWTWGLELIGYGGRTLLSASSSLTHDGGKISCQRDENLTEWFINDTRGLEQGWTIQSKPTPTTENLNLHLALRGDLKAKVSADSSSVAFQTASGTTALTYGGLKAWDADGKNLLVRFEPAGETAIRIAVEDQNARYPITIDPIAQQAHFASDTESYSSFDSSVTGSSIAISGDTVVFGSAAERSSTSGVNSTPNGNANGAGAAYVFVRDGTTWSQQAYLKASNTAAGANFGMTVAIAGETLVVGATGEGWSGAAYVFVRSGRTWTQQAYLKASNPGFLDYFGSSVAVSGDTVVVGSQWEDTSTKGLDVLAMPNEGAVNSGAAYVFVRDGVTWNQRAFLKAPQNDAADGFGASVAISGDTVVVGARGDDSRATVLDEDAPNSGAAFVFVGSGPSWNLQTFLKASNLGQDSFGLSVAVSGDTVVVGSAYESSSTTGVNSTPNENAYGAGAAYVFVRNGTTWSQQAYLKASNSEAVDLFGYSVAVSGDTAVVGAWGEDSVTTGTNSIPNDSMGSNRESGAAYAFVRSGETWSQQAYLKASNTGRTSFGRVVAVAGDSVLVAGGAQAYVFSGLGPMIGEPEIAIEEAGASLATGTTNAYGPGVAGTTTERIFTILNTGPGDLTLTGTPQVAVTGSPDFTVTSQPASPIAGPSGSTTFTVRFNSTSSGPKNAVLSIPNNDADENPFTINLSGSGVTAETAYLKAISSNSTLTGPSALPSATPFNDGVENLLKYAFNMNTAGPDVSVLTTGGTSGMPQITVDESGAEPVLKVAFLRRKGSGLIYTPQHSDTLGNFQTMTGTQTVTSIDAQWERVTVQEPAPPATVPSAFARVQVSLP